MYKVNRVARFVSENSRDIRLWIFILSQILILTDITYTKIYFALLVIASIAVWLSQIYCFKQFSAQYHSVFEALKRYVSGLLFCIGMIVIYICMF